MSVWVSVSISVPMPAPSRSHVDPEILHDVTDDFAHLIREPAHEPSGALVLLHGRGTDEHDLYPLFDAIDPRRRLTGVSVRGPLELPPGGYHWYRLAGIPTPDPASFTATFKALSAWLDALPNRIDVPWERTVLGGFSQGCVMAYAGGLGAGRPSPAGIIGLSGFIPRVPGFELDLANRPNLPVFVAHGALDEVIPVTFGREARDLLAEAGLDVSYHESPVPHTIDPHLPVALDKWLGGVLADQA